MGFLYFEISSGQHTWACVYDKAERDDGTLFFPERLTTEFLKEQKKVLGVYLYANQYQNEILPAGDQDFKQAWLKYFDTIPINHYTFAFVDPAISQQNTADYTAYVVVHVDSLGFWYVEAAKRQRINATDTISLLFEINERYKPMAIGLEIVAYQQSLLHFLDEEMRRRGVVIPVTGIRRGPEKSKEQRILSLVPRYEWGRILHTRGLDDLEDEYAKFPRSRHDDLLDALASIEDIAFLPTQENKEYEPKSLNDPNYERWYIQQLENEYSD